MSKIKVNFKHNNDEFNCYGVKNKEKIIFKENNNNLVIEIKENEILIEKTNKESIMNMIFKENVITNCTYNVIGLGKVFLNIKTNKLIIKNNKIYIEYEIIESNDLHIYELEYEVI